MTVLQIAHRCVAEADVLSPRDLELWFPDAVRELGLQEIAAARDEIAVHVARSHRSVPAAILLGVLLSLLDLEIENRIKGVGWKNV